MSGVPIHQRSYLIDGTLKTRDGAVQTVLSPVCVRTFVGALNPVEIGSYTSGEEPQGRTALEGAV